MNSRPLSAVTVPGRQRNSESRSIRLATLLPPRARTTATSITRPCTGQWARAPRDIAHTLLQRAPNPWPTSRWAAATTEALRACLRHLSFAASAVALVVPSATITLVHLRFTGNPSLIENRCGRRLPKRCRACVSWRRRDSAWPCLRPDATGSGTPAGTTPPRILAPLSSPLRPTSAAARSWSSPHPSSSSPATSPRRCGV